MPLLPLPPLDQAVPLDGGDLPVNSRADVAAVWDEKIQEPVTAPVRDAIQAGQTALMIATQAATSEAAAKSDPLRATGEYLDEIGDERDIRRQAGESDESYSARINAIPSVVSPDAIIAAVNAILAPYSAIQARYMERSDAWFIQDGTAVWSSHVFDGTIANAAPNYPDRLYAGATPAGLTSIPNRRPGGARVFADIYGRYFEIRIPDLAPVDQTIAAVFDGTQDGNKVGGWFVGDGTSALNTTYLWSTTGTESDIYNQIINTVDQLVGHSIRWTLLVDARLSA